MMDDKLTPAELVGLTGARTLQSQIRALVRLGIPFQFGGKQVAVKRAVAAELPQYRQEAAGVRLDLVR